MNRHEHWEVATDTGTRHIDASVLGVPLEPILVVEVDGEMLPLVLIGRAGVSITMWLSTRAATILVGPAPGFRPRLILP